MKQLFKLLFSLAFISCAGKAKQEDKSYDYPNIKIDTSWSGDEVISDSNFAYTVNRTCRIRGLFFEQTDSDREIYEKECALSSIKYSYEKLRDLNNEVAVGRTNAGIRIGIQSRKEMTDKNADVSFQNYLYTSQNGVLLDSLLIYNYSSYSSALNIQYRYFYLRDTTIFVVDVIEDEEGGYVRNWMKYNLNQMTGKIDLIKQKKFPYLRLEEATKEVEWKGEYNCIASNKDQIKTKFLININSLEDIKLIIQEGDDESIYSNVKACIVNDNKIKLVYKPIKENQMETLYIENSGGEFLISGNPIYFINPGTEELSLHKAK